MKPVQQIGVFQDANGSRPASVAPSDTIMIARPISDDGLKIEDTAIRTESYPDFARRRWAAGPSRAPTVADCGASCCRRSPRAPESPAGARNPCSGARSRDAHAERTAAQRRRTDSFPEDQHFV